MSSDDTGDTGHAHTSDEAFGTTDVDGIGDGGTSSVTDAGGMSNAGGTSESPPSTGAVGFLRRRVGRPLRAATGGVRRALGRLPRWVTLPLKVVSLIVVAVLGGWLGLVTFGATQQPIGPVETTIQFEPSWYGDTVLDLPPLGELTLDSHDGPVRLSVTVDQINQAEARELVNDPHLLDTLQDRVIDDVQSAVLAAAIRGLAVGTAGALVVSLIVVRRFRPTVLAGGLTAALILGTYGVAAGTWNPGAVAEPRYTGLLTGAPSLVGNVSDIAENFDAYRQQLVKLVTNVTQLYDVTSTLPAYRPDDDVIRVLHISDMELNEYAWDIVGSVADQYSADVIVDTGDTVDHGTAPENVFLERIPSLNLPYVWVRGNHDSTVTEQAMRQTENVVVLDGKIRNVGGIRFLGAGDPRFTPDRSSRNTKAEAAAVRAQALSVGKVAEAAIRAGNPADVIAFHDPDGASAFDGKAPLILAGHKHVRRQKQLPGGSQLMVQGSTGGSGLRALEAEDEPYPIDLSVLYLDQKTKQLEAWDDISLGGLGQTSAEIERHQAPDSDGKQPRDEDGDGTPAPSPSGEVDDVPESPLPTPTYTQSPSPTDTPSMPEATPSTATSPGRDTDSPPRRTPTRTGR